MVVQDPAERARECFLVAAPHQEAGIPHDLGNSASRVADDGGARRERLQRREPEALEERRMEEGLGAGVESGEGLVVDESGEHDAIGRNPLVRERIVKVMRELSQIAHDHQAQLAVAIGRPGERAQQAANVLARVELPHIEHVARRHAEAVARQGAPLVARRWGERVVDGLGHDVDALLRYAEALDDVLPRRVRDRDDRVGAARERVLPGVADARVRQAQVLARPDERREIVHREDRGERPPSRKGELRRVIEGRTRARKLEAQQHGVEREHRELRTTEARGLEVRVRREKPRVRRGEIPQPYEDPLDVARRGAREPRQQVARVAPDAADARHGLQMTRVERHAHRS